MSLFGSLMGDMEDDIFFGSHLRHMRQMNNMMNSLFSDPFRTFDGGCPLSITGPQHGTSLMPFMPQMPSLNRLFSVDMLDPHLSSGSSFSSSTVVMSSGLNGNPQVISSTSSTQIGPNGVKETRKTLQDSRTGTKKMSIGHHIGERAHVIERAQNVYSGDTEENQEFINLDEEEVEDFNKEFEDMSGARAYGSSSGNRRALPAPRPAHRRASPPLLALPPAPSAVAAPFPAHAAIANAPTVVNVGSGGSRRPSTITSRPTARRPIRTTASPLAGSSSASVRETYGSSLPQRHRHKSHKSSHSHRYAQDN